MGIALISVEVRNNDINKSLKLFKKKVEQSGHIQELRERRYYKKPSTLKREQMNAVLYRNKKSKEIEKEREKKAK